MKWTSLGLALTIAVGILMLVRRDHVQLRHAVWWIFVAFGIVILGAFPQWVDTIGHTLGVNYPPILAVLFSIGMILIKIVTMDIQRSRQERQIRRLTQRLAMLEKLTKEDPPKGP